MVFLVNAGYLLPLEQAAGFVIPLRAALGMMEVWWAKFEDHSPLDSIRSPRPPKCAGFQAQIEMGINFLQRFNSEKEYIKKFRERKVTLSWRLNSQVR